MGIIIDDEYETSNGLIVNQHYVCINEITQEKRGHTSFMIFIKISGYASKEAKENGKQHIYENTYGTTSNVPVNENIYDYSYNIVKGMYTKVTDDI
jgi:hypothetical protein